MNSPLITMLRIASLLGAVGLLGACHTLLHVGAHPMAVQTTTATAFKPHPVGRFLIDLPEESVFGHWYQTYGASGRISVVPEVAPEEFDAAVARRAEELRSIVHMKGGSRLIKVEEMALPHSRVIFYWEDSFSFLDPIKIDSYLLRDNVLYKFEGQTKGKPEKQRSDIRWLNVIFRAIRPLQPGEIPTEHGFCFDRSILVDEPSLEGPETVIATAVWLAHPDVHFRLITITNYKTTDPPLLTRVQRPSLFSGIRVLRSGPRHLASGEPGEEHLERIKEAHGAVGHLFVWEAQGLPMFKYEHPQIRLEMTTGNGQKGPQRASLSDEEALRIWDAVAGSIRLRPVATLRRSG